MKYPVFLAIQLLCVLSHKLLDSDDHHCCHKPHACLQEDASKPQKAKWRFLQKYWHKGAFFQDEAGGWLAMVGWLALLESRGSAELK